MNRHKQILLAADALIGCNHLRTTLEQEGCRVTCAAGREEAVKLTCGRAFDAYLLGVGAAREIRRFDVHTPMVILTTPDEAAVPPAGRACGQVYISRASDARQIAALLNLLIKTNVANIEMEEQAT